MDQGNLLKLVINKIKDQRYLFLIALVILVGLGMPWKLGVLVLVAGFLLVGIENILGKRGLRMAIALKFPRPHDPSTLNLVSCTYSFADPRRPRKKKSGEILPYKGGVGWLCPLPPHMKQSDTIDLSLKDDSGNDWVVTRFVPELGWPTVEVKAR